MLFNFSNVQSEEEVFDKLDKIRAEIMFKDREECLQIIRKIMYTYGVEEGYFTAESVERLLNMYNEKLNDTELERIASMCLVKLHYIQKEKEFEDLTANSI